jgi:RNA polymerase sigma-70 factor, ECF subfamily
MTDIRPLIENEIPHLRRYALLLTRNGERADDLVQDALLRAIDRQELWRPGSNLRAWLFTILHNLFINSFRRSKREIVSETGDDPVIVHYGDQNGSMLRRDLEKGLWSLPEDQRAVILLVALEEMSYQDVASVLGIPLGTVRSKLSRGRAALRQILDGEEHSAPVKTVEFG